MGHWLNKKKKETTDAKTAALKLKIGLEISSSFKHCLFTIHVLLIIEYSFSLSLSLCFFFHYCIDARTTQYYLPLLATTICLIDFYLCTWFIAICVHVVGQVGLVNVVWPANALPHIRSKIREKISVMPGFPICILHKKTNKNIRIRAYSQLHKSGSTKAKLDGRNEVI